MTSKQATAAKRGTSTKVTQSVVSIGFDSYLLPSDKALNLVSLMQHAVRCRETYRNDRPYITDGQMPELTLAVLSQKQIVTVSQAAFDNRSPFDPED